MNIIALVKQTPDTAKLSKTLNGMQLMADGQPRIVNPWDEYALETALQLKEKHGGKKVTALSVGKPEAIEALRTAVAMGVDEAILVSDPALANADSLGTAHALAAAIKKIGAFDVIVAGRNAIDGGTGATAVQVAALLGLPMVSFVSALKNVNAAGKSLTVVRAVDGGRETVTTQLPCVMSVVKDIAEPRYPSFMGIRKAAKAPIPTWTLADLGMAAPTSNISWAVELPAARETSVEFIQGTPQEMAAALMDKLIAQKVI
ncbi:MAG TPA: electron transfer flavoprotein subunit beta/FixA family protein [Thermoflexales bacterium]|nr:electron transfer flavoprotein subunit beta/FixA family protein [Thermoflexales bacterium]HQZ21758.1 electron transfer flavoprotein subunit beta/FixA family protein [Thermoflexales bacterium]